VEIGNSLCRKETPSTGKVEIGNSLHRKGGNRQLPPQERSSI